MVLLAPNAVRDTLLIQSLYIYDYHTMNILDKILGPPNSKKEEPAKITLVFHKFVDRYLLQGFDKVQVDKDDAELFAAIDSNQYLIHVQFTELSDPSIKLKHPLVWNVKDWKSCYQKWCMDKERSDRERRESCRMYENIELINKAMMKQFGIDDPEIFKKAATKMALTKSNDTKALQELGITIDIGS